MREPIKINAKQSYALTLIVLAERADNRRLATADPVETHFDAMTGRTFIHPATYRVLLDKVLVRWDRDQSGIVPTSTGAAYADGMHATLKALS